MCLFHAAALQRLGECLLHLVTHPTHAQLHNLAEILYISGRGACACHCREHTRNIVPRRSVTCVEPVLYRLLFACIQAFPIAALQE